MHLSERILSSEGEIHMELLFRLQACYYRELYVGEGKGNKSIKF